VFLIVDPLLSKLVPDTSSFVESEALFASRLVQEILLQAPSRGLKQSECALSIAVIYHAVSSDRALRDLLGQLFAVVVSQCTLCGNLLGLG
jgi:hypothetical protein